MTLICFIRLWRNAANVDVIGHWKNFAIKKRFPQRGKRVSSLFPFGILNGAVKLQKVTVIRAKSERKSTESHLSSLHFTTWTDEGRKWSCLNIEPLPLFCQILLNRARRFLLMRSVNQKTFLQVAKWKKFDFSSIGSVSWWSGSLHDREILGSIPVAHNTAFGGAWTAHYKNINIKALSLLHTLFIIDQTKPSQNYYSTMSLEC